MSSIAESLLSGALGEGIDILDEKEEDRKSAFLSNLEQGEQAGGDYLKDLIENSVGEIENKATAFNQTFDSINSNKFYYNKTLMLLQEHLKLQKKE